MYLQQGDAMQFIEHNQPIEKYSIEFFCKKQICLHDIHALIAHETSKYLSTVVVHVCRQLRYMFSCDSVEFKCMTRLTPLQPRYISTHVPRLQSYTQQCYICMRDTVIFKYATMLRICTQQCYICMCNTVICKYVTMLRT